MTDQNSTLATVEPTGRAGDIATQTATMSLTEKVEYAKLLADSGMIPECYRRQPGNVLVAVEYGQALGLDPIVAMSQIVVVKGKASMEAKLMITLARKAGHVVRLEGDEESATCTIVLADDPGNPRTVTYTKSKAQSAGLWGQGYWAKDPALMLQYRAASQAIRLHCPEVLAGVSYTPEEAEEIARRNQTSHVVTQVAAVKAERTVADYMKTLRLTGQDLKALSSRVLGADVTSWEKLTDAQRTRVLDTLAQWETTGEDPTMAEQVDAELIDEETGEVAR